jgi:hypothetical protein
MRCKIVYTLLVWILLVALSISSKAAPIGTAWTYQGRLIDNNDVADGLFDFQFKLYDDPNGNIPLADATVGDVDVIDGHFTIQLDFGSSVFDGNAVWLEINVRPGELADPNNYTKLNPRQEVTPTPYALYAKNAGPDHDWQVGNDRMYSIPNVNVGIGVVEPNEKLHVNGTVKAARVAYISPRTHYCAVSGDAFLPRTNTTSTYARGYPGAFMVSGTDDVMTAPVHLPHGAVVTEFTAYFYDDFVAGDLTVSLEKILYSGTYDTMAEVDSSAITGYGGSTDASVSSSTVDNSTGAYQVRVHAPNWTFLDMGHQRRIMGASIAYTLDEAP